MAVHGQLPEQLTMTSINNSPTLLSQGNGQVSDVQSDVNSFANRTKRTLFTKEQGIIMHAVDGIKPEEYVYALGEITAPINILNFSKISNQRIRIYLKNKTIAENITNTYKKIQVKDADNKLHDVSIRPLSIQTKRIVISGACPEIPDDLLINELKKLGLTPTSTMNFLRAGLKPNFEHITSAKRSIYVTRDDIHIPDTILINFEGSLNRIFLSDDSLFCLRCKKHGHESSSCRNNEPRTVNREENAQRREPNTLANNIQKLLERNVNLPATSEGPSSSQNDMTQKNIPKRPLVSVSSLDDAEESTQNYDKKHSNTTDEEQTDFETVTRKRSQKRTKKKKLTSTTPASQDVTADEAFLTENNVKKEMKKNPQEYCLNFEQLEELLENSQNIKNPLEITKDYVSDTNTLVDTLDNLYPLLENTKNKHRFTRLKNKILKELENKDIEENNTQMMTEPPTTTNKN